MVGSLPGRHLSRGMTGLDLHFIKRPQQQLQRLERRRLETTYLLGSGEQESNATPENTVWRTLKHLLREQRCTVCVSKTPKHPSAESKSINHCTSHNKTPAGGRNERTGATCVSGKIKSGRQVAEVLCIA